MPGVRLRHLVDRNCTYTLVDRRRPLTAPYDCKAAVIVPFIGEVVPCGRVHIFKTYHLNLDDTGAVIVSETIWERIRNQLLGAGFSLVNEVAEPPEQRILIPTIIVPTQQHTPEVKKDGRQ